MLKMQDEIKKEAERHLKILARHEEQFIKAFIARYGCGPEDLVICTEQNRMGYKVTQRIWVEIRGDNFCEDCGGKIEHAKDICETCFKQKMRYIKNG